MYFNWLSDSENYIRFIFFVFIFFYDIECIIEENRGEGLIDVIFFIVCFLNGLLICLL